MNQSPKYKRILLKLSGEALLGKDGYGIDGARVDAYVEEIRQITEMGVEVAIVIGGGNIFRGIQGSEKGVDRVKGDYMGMLATVINGLALQSALEKSQVKTRVFTAIRMEPVGEFYNQLHVKEALHNKEVAIFTAGTGNPFFTTDTAAALRAVEISADALLKGTRVDGVYTADPEQDPNAQKYDTVSFDEAYAQNLRIMDMTAFTMCKENHLPIVVFNMNTPGNLKNLLLGDKIGTLVKN